MDVSERHALTTYETVLSCMLEKFLNLVKIRIFWMIIIVGWGAESALGVVCNCDYLGSSSAQEHLPSGAFLLSRVLNLTFFRLKHFRREFLLAWQVFLVCLDLRETPIQTRMNAQPAFCAPSNQARAPDARLFSFVFCWICTFRSKPDLASRSCRSRLFSFLPADAGDQRPHEDASRPVPEERRRRGAGRAARRALRHLLPVRAAAAARRTAPRLHLQV